MVGAHPDRDGELMLRNLPGRTARTRTAACYRKHFLDLEGAGIRDLCLVGRDLLVLTGPPMRGKGKAQVRLWKAALAIRQESMRQQEDLRKLLELPYREKKDHAEGITIVGRRWQPRDAAGPLRLCRQGPAPAARRDVGDGAWADMPR